MKTRSGYVSNSSSSSFIIGLKKGIVEDSVDFTSKMCKVLGISKTSPFMFIVEDFIREVKYSIDDKKYLLDFYLQEFYCKTEEEFKEDYGHAYKIIKSLEEKEMLPIHVTFSSEDEGIGVMFYEAEPSVDSEDVFISVI